MGSGWGQEGHASCSLEIHSLLSIYWTSSVISMLGLDQY